MATIALHGLSRRYDGAPAPALDHLDLEVHDGEFLCLVGPSGCGKSTALRLIAGLDAPDSGRVEIDGRDLGRVAPQDRDVAMVFQGYALYPHLSVRDNMAFPLKMRKVPREIRQARVEEIAATLGLSGLLSRTPGELSGGERQRVAMGRAMVRSPKAFLFDEPLSNLDAKLRGELRIEIGALVRRLGTTSIYVTHDQVEAMTLGDRIAVMRGGVLQQIGTPRAIYEDPSSQFVAGFIGSPAMNFIEVERAEGRLRAPGVSLPAPEHIDLPRRAVIGLRPEHLRIDPSGERASIAGEVVATEPLGAETNLIVDAEGTRLVARAQGFDAPARGEPTRLTVAMERALYFDVETGARLRSRDPG